MQEKLLKKIISDFAGPQAEKLVDLMYKKQNVNEFLIAKKLDFNINQTRNLLYKLADNGLVEFVRKKDRKKGGWYTYFWTLKVKKSLLKFKEEVEKKQKHLYCRLSERKNARYFYCKNCNIEYDEETAMLNNFTCSECGEVLQAEERSEVFEHLKKESAKLEETRLQLVQEMEKLEAKEERIRVEQKKRELERKKKKGKLKQKQMKKRKIKKESKKKARRIKKKPKKRKPTSKKRKKKR